ncbi:hypothetical protein LZ32DRAFT_548664 [Colletotrichum eremochloae]|nr:hypothetical protein LZ32DRAFT_548664 [Colletotrichum eremochloae]
MSATSIQAFYKKEPPTSPRTAPADRWPRKDDGFTQAEINYGHNPLDRPWNPSEDYETVCIGDIQLGPTRIRFTGRIVNYAPAFLDIKKTYSRPAHQLIITDDTGAIGVSLVPIGIPVSRLVIGQLVTVWASWIGTAVGSNHGNIPFVTMYTPINPADVGTKQFIQFLPHTTENQGLCRVPLEYDDHGQKPKLLSGLMTLRQYLKTGHDIRGARIIVCIKGFGARKRIKMQERTKEAELLEVSVCDDTTSCVLTLWEDKASSAKLWKPNETILLLTNPKFVPPRDIKPLPTSACISLNYNTLVDVDPNFQDANWLREWVAKRVEREAVFFPFPEGVWNAEVAINGPIRPLFTLAEVDDFARADPATDFTGKLNLTVLGINLLELHRRKMMFCMECCGVPLYANKPSATCKNCMKQQSLVLNARVMGTLADETGCITQGKLVWGDQAWGELFFPTVEPTPAIPVLETVGVARTFPAPTFQTAPLRKLATMETSGLRILEEQILYARLTLTFGWSPFVKRLCVLGVEW